MPPYLTSPALPQKLQRRANVDDGEGSRHKNQNNRCTFQALRWFSIILMAPESSCAWPIRPWLMPKRSGGADPQPSSVIHSGVPWSPCFRITARNSWSCWRSPAMLFE